MPSHGPTRPHKAPPKKLQPEAPKELASKEAGFWWRRISIEGRVLAIIGVLTILVTALAIPDYPYLLRVLGLKPPAAVNLPHLPTPKPPSGAMTGPAEVPKEGTAPKAIFRTVPLRNAPDPEKKPPPLMTEKLRSGAKRELMPGLLVPGVLHPHALEQAGLTPTLVNEEVARKHLIHKVEPILIGPFDGSGQPTRLVLTVLIAEDGTVESAEVVPHAPGDARNDPAVEQAVIDAVMQWKYQPFVVAGRSATVTTNVTFFKKHEP